MQELIQNIVSQSQENLHYGYTNLFISSNSVK